MIADLLLRPDNRLLGGATGDFSLFGGQPVPGVSFARETGQAGHVSIAAPAMPGAAHATDPVPAEARPSAAPVDDAPVVSDSGATTLSTIAPTPAPQMPGQEGPTATTADELVPAAQSSGGLFTGGVAVLGLADAIPAPPTPVSEPAGNPLGAVTAGFGTPTLDQLVPQTGTLTATIADATAALTDIVDDAIVCPVADDILDPTLAPVAAAAADTVAPVTTAVGEVAAPVVATVADVAAPVGAVLADVADIAMPVVDTVVDTVAPIAAAAAPATAPIAEAVQPAGAALQPATEAVASIAGDAFGGSDPAAGVQTLVGIVANADAFDVIAPGTAAADPSPSVIDDLIGDGSEVAPLLGDHDADDDGSGLFGGHDGIAG